MDDAGVPKRISHEDADYVSGIVMTMANQYVSPLMREFGMKAIGHFDGERG